MNFFWNAFSHISLIKTFAIDTPLYSKLHTYTHAFRTSIEWSWNASMNLSINLMYLLALSKQMITNMSIIHAWYFITFKLFFFVNLFIFFALKQPWKWVISKRHFACNVNERMKREKKKRKKVVNIFINYAVDLITMRNVWIYNVSQHSVCVWCSRHVRIIELHSIHLNRLWVQLNWLAFNLDEKMSYFWPVNLF